jgi:hypothetical protein
MTAVGAIGANAPIILTETGSQAAPNGLRTT